MTLMAPVLHQLKVPLAPELHAYVTRLYGAVNAALKSGAYVGGATLSSADISIWVLFSHLVAHAPFANLPQLQAWYDGIAKLPQLMVRERERVQNVRIVLVNNPSVSCTQESLAEFKTSPKGLDQFNTLSGIHMNLRGGAKNADLEATEAEVDVPESELADARAAFAFKPFVATKEPRTV